MFLWRNIVVITILFVAQYVTSLPPLSFFSYLCMVPNNSHLTFSRSAYLCLLVSYNNLQIVPWHTIHPFWIDCRIFFWLPHRHHFFSVLIWITDVLMNLEWNVAVMIRLVKAVRHSILSALLICFSRSKVDRQSCERWACTEGIVFRIHICYLPAGRSVWWKTVTEVTVFHRTDRP